jgi:hypothetical protein
MDPFQENYYMGLLRRWHYLLLMMVLLSGVILQFGASIQVSAQDGDEDPPAGRRTAKISVTFTRTKWWLIRWSNNQIVCSFYSEREGLPSIADVEGQCSATILEDWQDTTPCNIAAVESTKQCPGLYLQWVESKPGEREIDLELPTPKVWVSITNCNAVPPETRCTTLPSLVLTGEEPLPNELIISIQGRLGGADFQCAGSECVLPLQPTGLEGTTVEFWADSSYGDSSEVYTARVRLVPWGEFMNPEARSQEVAQYYVDVLSSQWHGEPVASCAETWQTFPNIGGPPLWLTSPQTHEELQSDVSYYYLAGALITYGLVDTGICLDGGLQAPSIASPCGVEAARPQLIEWQNRFDDEILQASLETGIPARLLKNVFSRESQIWPGIFRTYREAGLGQLTENGADTVLLWNPNFFHQFCPLILNQSYCDMGYGNLSNSYPDLQNMLMGALVRKVNADCPDCPASIDLSQANYSVRVFAEGLLANCEQVSRIVTNLTQLSPGQVSAYDDLWRFTLVNYNAGPGCLSRAMQKAFQSGMPLDWPNVAANLEPACQLATGYVEDITQMLKVVPTPTVWLPFGDALPTPVLPRVLNSPTPVFTPTPGGPTPTPGPSETPVPDGAPLPTPTITATPPDYP